MEKMHLLKSDFNCYDIKDENMVFPLQVILFIIIWNSILKYVTECLSVDYAVQLVCWMTLKVDSSKISRLKSGFCLQKHYVSLLQNETRTQTPLKINFRIYYIVSYSKKSTKLYKMFKTL